MNATISQEKTDDQITTGSRKPSIEIVTTVDGVSRTYKMTDEQLATAFVLASSQSSLATAKPSGIPAIAPPGQEYADPYLFEIGHFKDRAEYEELSRSAKIKPRARA